MLCHVDVAFVSVRDFRLRRSLAERSVYCDLTAHQSDFNALTALPNPAQVCMKVQALGYTVDGSAEVSCDVPYTAGSCCIVLKRAAAEHRSQPELPVELPCLLLCSTWYIRE